MRGESALAVASINEKNRIATIMSRMARALGERLFIPKSYAGGRDV